MSKHETSLIAEKVDPDLLRRTEAAILDFMDKNDGKMPTQQQVNGTVKTSYTRLGPAMRMVKARLDATQTKLANMPEIPDDLRQAHEQMLKELWARTRELQNGEIVELRQVQADKARGYQRDIAEAEEVIAIIEAAQKRETQRAAAAEAECAELRKRLDEVIADLTQANGRLAEREFIIEMIAQKQNDPAEAGKTGKSAPRYRADAEPETGHLFDAGWANDPEAGPSD